MTPERKKRVALCLCILCGMIVCTIYSLRHGPHHLAFGVANCVLLLINSWLTYNYGSKRQPDKLIHLFPIPPENSKERF